MTPRQGASNKEKKLFKKQVVSKLLSIRLETFKEEEFPTPKVFQGLLLYSTKLISNKLLQFSFVSLQVLQVLGNRLLNQDS